MISGLKKFACLCFCEIIKQLKYLFSYVCLFMAGPRCLAATVSATNYLLVPRDGVTTVVVEPLHMSNQLLIKLTCIVFRCCVLLRRTLFCTFQRPQYQNRANFALLIVICHPHLVGDNRKDRTDDIRPMCLGVVVPPFLYALHYALQYALQHILVVPCTTSGPAFSLISTQKEGVQAFDGRYLSIVHIPANQTTLCM